MHVKAKLEKAGVDHAACVTDGPLTRRGRTECVREDASHLKKSLEFFRMGELGGS